jgi:RNA 2',3'-cyclic 3'-phosphodiesterase
MDRGSDQPTRRLFFALWPDEATRAMLAHATRKAVRGCGGRPVAAHNLHATLLFLGSVAQSRVSEVTAIAARAAANMAVPGTVDSSSPGFVFDRIEFWKKPHVLVAAPSVAGGAGDVLAGALAEVLARVMLSAGFAPDPKPFRPHVTVARKVAFLKTELSMQPVPWSFQDFALVESQTDPDGPVYTVLESYPLAPGDRPPRV